ncbi:hypothetical protein OIU34_24065 [Pararhizobium sp. BT-229]|uniref:hypothetical protein n=1 Tax=Pararhizobium sp. BT-229 TaxID=2986923 RepID=UPI0021F6F03C|nr:hypothetical protein [Pararhizobium sp. BT-229]MCV9964975.1 hypothetical protein [Pararhizobium sp. BT-229]
MLPGFKDYVFEQNAGEVIGDDGKSHWPALVRVKIQRERALDAAIQLLNAVNDPYRCDEQFFELTMFGTLEELPAD